MIFEKIDYMIEGSESMGKKYIVEIEENQNLYKTMVTSDGKSYMAVAYREPYTEPDLEQIRKEAYEQGQENLRKSCVPKDEEAYSIGYNEGFQCGLDLAWDAARKIANTPYGEEEKVFGSDGWTFIVNHTAQEAIEKIRQYEQEKDRQARIEYNFDEIKDVLNTTMKECNVSLDDIAEVLQKMREN